MLLLLRPVQTQSFDDMVFLYALLAMRLNEPGANISHIALPSWHEHVSFINHPPYRRWDLIIDGECDERIGIAYITKPDETQNTVGDEVGMYILPYCRRYGVGETVIKHYQADNDRLLANISKTNRASQMFFTKHGFGLIREEPKQLVFEWKRD